MINFLMMVFAGRQIKLMLMITIALWALVNTCEWGHQTLKSNPGFPVIGVLKPLFDYVKVERIAVVQLKVNIEVLIGFLSLFTWYLSWCAPLFPCIYV